MKVLYFLALLCLLAQSNNVVGLSGFGPTDLLGSANTIVQGVGKEIINVIPTPGELFKASKQVLFGLPEKAIFKTINNLCSLYLAADTINPKITPAIESMSFILRSPCRTSKFPLTHADEILSSPDFDVNKKVALFVTGWMSDPTEDYVTDMANAFNCRGDYNFLVLDSSDSIDTLYTWSAYNTEEVGRQVALGLEKLVEQVPAENIYLIGHSLGAHIVGYAGRYFNAYTGLNLTRITGLDPANPCFNEGQTLSGLQRGDAEFIDVIHTNPGVFGKENPVGDADFYADGLAPIKPGCTRFGCSHGRAPEYFTESVYPGNEENFLGTRCTTLTSLNNRFCNGPQFPMGLATPNNLKGNYFLNVNGKSPYGKNHDNQDSVSSDCGKCGAAVSQ